MNITKLIFVYNADSGIMASLADVVHKAVSPGTYACNLCRITYGSVAMKQDWKTFVVSLPYPVEFLHRDEFAARYPQAKDISFPALFADGNDGIRLLLAASEIDKAHDVTGLEALVTRVLPQKERETETYRCPECGLRYRDKETAATCEAWCREHKSCNLDIIKNAIPE